MTRVRKPIPAASPTGRPLIGPTVLGYSVCAWSPDPVPGRSPPEAVAFVVEADFGSGVLGDIVIRVKSRAEMDRLITLLGTYAQEVWPEEAS